MTHHKKKTAYHSKSCFTDIEKYHGNGNDFLFLPFSIFSKFSSRKELKKFLNKICHRQLSIGSDGVIIYQVQKITKKIHFIIVNADGSFAETCGNALRCFGLFLFRHNLWNGQTSLKVYRPKLPNYIKRDLDTSENYLLQTHDPFAFIEKLRLLNSEKYQQGRAIVNVIFFPSKHINLWREPKELNINGFKSAVFVQLENPHLIFYSSNFKTFKEKDYAEFGKKIQKHYEANISMVFSNDKKECNGFQVCTYERGAGLTQACGSGAIATALALKFIRKIQDLKDPIKLYMPGGLIEVQEFDMDKQSFCSHEDYLIRLSGQAEFIFSARIRVASA